MKTKISYQPEWKAAALLLLFSFVSLCAFSQQKETWVAPESAKKLKNTVTVGDSASLAAGKTLYVKNCKSCHGSGGRGDGPKAASLDVPSGDFTSEEFKKQTDGEIFWKSTEGKDPMPSFKLKMSDEERWKVVSYIRTLEKKVKKT